MTSLVTRRVRQLANTLAELKIKVRTMLVTELAGAAGNVIRDVLVATILDRLAGTIRSLSRDWRDNDCEHEQWSAPRDQWTDDYDRGPPPVRYDLDELEEEKSLPAIPAVTAGVNIRHWWFAKKGSLIAAVSIGLVATTLGLAGGLIARTILCVLTAATDMLTADTILARPIPPE